MGKVREEKREDGKFFLCFNAVSPEDSLNFLHCSQRIYSNYERGDVDIPTEILIKLADFHDVSVDYLLGRTDNPKTNR